MVTWNALRLMNTRVRIRVCRAPRARCGLFFEAARVAAHGAAPAPGGPGTRTHGRGLFFYVRGVFFRPVVQPAVKARPRERRTANAMHRRVIGVRLGLSKLRAHRVTGPTAIGAQQIAHSSPVFSALISRRYACPQLQTKRAFSSRSCIRATACFISAILGLMVKGTALFGESLVCFGRTLAVRSSLVPTYSKASGSAGCNPPARTPLCRGIRLDVSGRATLLWTRPTCRTVA